MTDSNYTCTDNTVQRPRNRKLTTREFIRRAKIAHGDVYSYGSTEYVNRRTKVNITCELHGDFKQRPDMHMRGHGCGRCADTDAALSNEEFILRAKKVYGEQNHCYKKTRYKKSRAKVTVGCRTHGYFEVVARNYLRGMSCPDCCQGGSGYSRGYFEQACHKNGNGNGLLYIIECFSESERFYKIGITSRGVDDRFGNKDKMPYRFKVVTEILGEADYIYDLENKIHNIQKDLRYRPAISFNGQTECFSSIAARTRLILGIE